MNIPFSAELKRIIQRMMDKDPSSLNDKLLLEYHRKTHMLYAGAINRKPLNREFISWILSYHNRLVKEMLKRKFKHNSPLKQI
jgi:hypothetical protein